MCFAILERFTLLRVIFNYLCYCVSVHVRSGSYGGQKRHSDPLDLKLRTILSMALGIQLRSFTDQQVLITAEPSF